EWRGNEYTKHSDDRKLEVLVQTEQQNEDQCHGDGKNQLQLAARPRVFLELSAPDNPIAGRESDFRRDGAPCLLDSARQITTFYGILYSDITRVVLPIDE